MTTTIPAHDLAAEQAVLGAALLAPAVVADLAGTLTPGDFYRPAHAALWEALCGMHAAGLPRRPDRRRRAPRRNRATEPDRRRRLPAHVDAGRPHRRQRRPLRAHRRRARPPSPGRRTRRPPVAARRHRRPGRAARRRPRRARHRTRAGVAGADPARRAAGPARVPGARPARLGRRHGRRRRGVHPNPARPGRLHRPRRAVHRRRRTRRDRSPRVVARTDERVRRGGAATRLAQVGGVRRPHRPAAGRRENPHRANQTRHRRSEPRPTRRRQIRREGRHQRRQRGNQPRPVPRRRHRRRDDRRRHRHPRRTATHRRRRHRRARRHPARRAGRTPGCALPRRRHLRHPRRPLLRHPQPGGLPQRPRRRHAPRRPPGPQIRTRRQARPHPRPSRATRGAARHRHHARLPRQGATRPHPVLRPRKHRRPPPHRHRPRPRHGRRGLRHQPHRPGLLPRRLDRPAVLTLTPEANDRVLDLERTVEPPLAPGDQWTHIVDWGSKYVGAIVRLAGLLHLADHLRDGWGEPIDAATINRAATLGAYYADHALAAFDDMGADPVVEDARIVLAWITRTGCARFTKRELFSGMYRGRFRTAGDLEPALSLLTSHGYIQPEPERAGPGRRPSPAYLVHPDLANGRLPEASP